MPKNKSKAAVEELEDDDLELMDEDEDEAPAKPTGKKAKTVKTAEKPAPKAERAESNGMGAAWLADHINEELGTSISAANIRVILRKMAKDGDFEREVGTDRARYQFTGEKDPIVRAVLKRIRSGEATRDKVEALEAATAPRKARKAVAAVIEEEPEAKPAKGKRKAKAEPEVEEAPAKKSARRRRNTEDE